jgi:ABC-type sugar transport system permease subunit
VLLFLAPPAAILLGFLVYPIGYTVVRSLFDASGETFVGLENYRRIVQEPRTLIALRNNLIWVAVAPTLVTSIGLVLAVLSERVSWKSAFRFLLFMPLVVSGLAAGVAFRFIYASDPQVGLANAITQGIVHAFEPPGEYWGARPTDPPESTTGGTERRGTGTGAAPGQAVETESGALRYNRPIRAGDIVTVGLVGIPPSRVPGEAERARPPDGDAGNRGSGGGAAVTGTVWLDFTPGGGGTRGVPNAGERGLPGIPVQLLQDGEVVAEGTTGANGRFAVPAREGERYTLQLSEAAFREPDPGITWLGPTLITASIIFVYIWIHTGFALVVIGAGLANINRELLAAARVEGANEFQVFRHVTVPLLRPVVTVVLVSTIISSLKVFDLVYVIAPESVQPDANVLALEMWRASFGGAHDFGLGSAIGTVLFLLILPAMLFNLRRFRMEQ